MAAMHDRTHLTAGNRTSSSEAAWKVHTARRNLWRSTRPRSCEALVSRLCWSLDACSETSCGGSGHFSKGQQLEHPISMSSSWMMFLGYCRA